MKRFFLLLLLLAAACGDNRLSHVGTGVRVEPTHVSFGRAWVGLDQVQRVQVTNDARGRVEVAASVAAPFTLSADRVAIAGGDSAELELHLLGVAPGAASATLSISTADQVLEVPVDAELRVPPDCAAAEDCRIAEFDPVAGACVERNTADGAPCGAANLCLANGRCVAGECVGAARDCDDRDACTRDGCVPALGCTHDDVSGQCAGAAPESCLVPRCDPLTGCGLVAAADGAPCGANDCTTARVCVAGQCVDRAAPEGSACAPATPCRDEGQCRERACVTPPERPMTPLWSWKPAPDRSFNFQGAADFDGNLYFSEGLTAGGDVHVVSLTMDGYVRFRALLPGARSWYSVGIVVDDAARRLYVSTRTKALALSSVDGRVIWETDLTTNVPVRDPASNGQGAFWANAEAMVGADLVVFQLSEGNTDHWAYIEALDRSTGAERWRLSRKGHLYGVAGTAGGDAWFSYANCWAPAGNVERVSATGVSASSGFVQGFIQAVTGSAAVVVGYPDSTVLTGSANLRLAPPSGEQLGRSIVALGSQLFIPSASGVPAVMTYDTGSSRWGVFAKPAHLGRGFDLQLVAPAGVVVSGAGDVANAGRLVRLDASGAETLNCPLTASPVSAVTVRERFVANVGGAIQAYELKGADAVRAGWSGVAGGITRDRRFK